MRNLLAPPLSVYRQRKLERRIFGGDGGAGEGLFFIKSPIDREILRIIASSGMGWDHVSVSRADRTPIWDEMDRVARLFFEDHEAAMQLHVPPIDHINLHPYTLHIWRPQDVDIPRPPSNMVGF